MMSIVSTSSGLRDRDNICRIDDTTSSTEMSFMQRWSNSQVFERQQGAHGTSEYKLQLQLYPDCQGASRPPKMMTLGHSTARARCIRNPTVPT